MRTTFPSSSDFIKSPTNVSAGSDLPNSKRSKDLLPHKSLVPGDLILLPVAHCVRRSYSIGTG